MIEKTQFVDKIEVLDNGVVQVRIATAIIEDGVELVKTYHRHCVVPGQDLSDEIKLVQDICSVVHTKEKILQYAQQLEKQQ
jgi:predicted nucleic acid-binding Zn ribbon protein